MKKKKSNSYIYPKLKGVRHEKGYTMQGMADILGISKGCYFKKENGFTDFYLDEVNKILNLFHCSFDDIFFEKIVNQKVNKDITDE